MVKGQDRKPHRPGRSRALVLLAHGSQANADSSAPAHCQADEIRRRGLFDEVLAAFWKEEPNLSHAIDLVESDDVFVVPYFISRGYFTEEVLPRELGVSGRRGERAGRRIFYGEPVGTHPSMTHALRRCAEKMLLQGVGSPPPAAETTLVVVGHGTTQNENSAEAVLRQVELLKRERIFADVLPAFIDQEPFDREALGRIQTPNGVVIPFFISDGFHSQEDIPVNMGFAKQGQSWTHPILNPRGSDNPRLERLWYAGAIGSEPWMADVILDRVRDLELEAGPSKPLSPKGKREAASERFAAQVRSLGKLEFGELFLRAENETFSVCHRRDRNATGDRLDRLQGPEDAHELGRWSEDGNYRPLKSAPTLRRGWILEKLSSEALRLFVDLIYPGAIRHWAMARDGTLQIRNFKETAERQSGLYANVRKLKADRVRALAEMKCGERGCCRHPLWTVGDRGSGAVLEKVRNSNSCVIPCPEPCNHWLTAALR